MKMLFTLIIFGLMGYGAFYLLAPQDKKNAVSGGVSGRAEQRANSALSLIDQNNRKAIKDSSGSPTPNMAISFHNGIAIPSTTGYLQENGVGNEGSGKIIINNSRAGTNIVVDVRNTSNRKTIASALVTSGRTFTFDNLPTARVNLLIVDTRNSQVTTTRAINTTENYRITPYQMTSGNGSILLYNAESTIR